MKSVVVYESMYGNTHLIAAAIGDGLREPATSSSFRCGGAAEMLGRVPICVVVGGPTHAHGMSRAATRQGAIAAAAKAEGRPRRRSPTHPGPVCGSGSTPSTGSTSTPPRSTRDSTCPPCSPVAASKGIARKLRHHGAHLVADPESFLVTKGDRLEPREEERARNVGAPISVDVPRRRGRRLGVRWAPPYAGARRPTTAVRARGRVRRPRTSAVSSSSARSTRASTVVAREHHADEAHLDLAVREELLAPRVEQQAVRGPGGLHPLRDEARAARGRPTASGRSGSCRGASTRARGPR